MMKFFSGLCLFVCLFISPKLYAQTERSINAPVDSRENLPVETVPNMTQPTGSETLKGNYSHIDPSHVVPDLILRQAILFYDVNLEKISNKDYLTILDFNQHSSQRRMYLINMKTGAVTPMLAAAGAGSDPDKDGYATLFSNVVDSHMSSLGFYLTSSTYEGQNGYSLRLHGLNETNSKAYERMIVVHGAQYVSESQGKAGPSWGCPAVDHSLKTKLIDRIKNGSLMFFTHASLRL
jgi:hypothetical protein